jgi:hypothetical protein
MQKVFEVPVVRPSSWKPPHVEDHFEDSSVPLQFKLTRDWDGKTYHYTCSGCMSAGGEIDDIFRTSSGEESEWPYGDDGVPIRLAHEMFAHGRQHNILWRWSVNRIPPPEYDK